jgi:hypothetical protein
VAVSWQREAEARGNFGDCGNRRRHRRQSPGERAQIHEQSADRSGHGHGSSQHVGDTLREATTAASDAASGAADAIKDRFDEGVAYAQRNFSKASEALPGKETLAQVQSSFADLLERQPLLLGAIGLAVGAAVAGAFSASDLENEWVGELSDSVKEDPNARAGAVSQSVREASDTLTAEVEDIGAETPERLHETGRSGVNAVRESLKTR